MSMLRSVLTYMGLGPDEDYDDGYLYEADRRAASARPGRLDAPEGETIDLRDDAEDPHAQRRRPDWMGFGSNGEVEAVAIEPEMTAGDEAAVLDETKIDSSGAEYVDDDRPVHRGRHDVDRTTEGVRPLRAVPAGYATPGEDGVMVRTVSNEREESTNKVASSGPRQVKPTVLVPQSFGDAKTLADEFKASRPLVMNLQSVDRDLARRLIDFASGICYALDGGMEKVASQVFLLIPDETEVSEDERRRLEQRGFRQ